MKRIASFWGAAAFVVAMTLSVIGLQQVQAAQPFNLGGASAPQNPVSTCAYDNLGWIICPVLRATSQAGDYAFTFVSEKFMVVDVNLFDTDSGAMQASGVMSAIANVLFVIAFLYIVYSLITGKGMDNYNIKRLVPRFILAVIFVNISFYICQAMVDISNVIGYTVYQALVDGIAGNIGPSAMPLASEPGKYDVSPLFDITAGVITKQEIAWVLLAPMTAVVMSAAVICSILIVVLIVRQTLVVALVLLAPLAFFAYLLPNTTDYFSKWLKLFIHILILYPIIAILVGTGQIVSASILKAGSSDYKVDNDTILVSGSQNSATLYLVAVGAAVLPLAGTWYVFKAATNGLDAAGAKVSRNGLRRSSRERDEKVKQREQTNMDLNKKSMMLRGINRLQQLNVAQDGESKASVFGKMGGAYRSRSKHQAKSPEQAKFDSQVQDRLSEIRSKSAATGASPQEMYSQALQKYQEKGGDTTNGDFNINSYEGIDLKASEAYLLESLGKGGVATSTAVGAVAANGAAAQQGGDQKAGQKADQKEEKKSAGISSLNRDGKQSGGGGGGGGQEPSDPYKAPSTGGISIPAAGSTPSQQAAALAGASSHYSKPGASGGGAAPTIPEGATVIIQQVAPSQDTAGSAMGPGSVAGYAARRPMQSSNELLAKARAAKYVADTQDLIAEGDDDILKAAEAANVTDIPNEPRDLNP